MTVTLEQARTLDAFERQGSFAKAAVALNKVHSAVVYGLRGLEDAVGAAILDRSGYRTVLNPLGRRVLEHCRRLLDAEAELLALSRSVQAGQEPLLTVVYDGLLPVSPILAAVRRVGEVTPHTQVALFSEFLADVEARAERSRADVMLMVVPPTAPIGPERSLPPLVSLLVARADHPLSQLAAGLSADDLARHPFLTVRGSDQRLRMETTALAKGAEFWLSDFHAKRVALLQGMGWGWMPAYLVEDDVADGALVVLPWGPTEGRHVFRPTLHCRRDSAGGPAVETFIAAIAGAGWGG